MKSPNFVSRTSHVLLIWQLCWLVAFGVYYYAQMSLQAGYLSITEWVLAGLGFITIVLNLLYFIPHNMRILALVGNVQMLKDKKLIREVIDEK